MQSAFAAAEPLYAQSRHPRVALGPDELVELRRKVRSGDGLKIMDALRRKVRVLAEEAKHSTAWPQILEGNGRHNSLAARIAFGIDDLALVAALDEDADTLDLFQRLFAAVPHLVSKSPRPRVASLAGPFDLLYAYLSAAQRAAYVEQAVSAIRTEIGRTAKAYFRCAGGNMTLLTVLYNVPLVLAIQGESGAPDLRETLDYLIKCFEATLHTAINPDGYPEEDIGYGTHVTASLAVIGEMLRRAGVFDVYAESPRLARFGQAMLHFVQPWGEHLSNTGDHGDDFGNREFVLARLASETRDPALLWLLGTLSYNHGIIIPANTLPEFYVEVPLRPGFQTPASHLSLLVLDELCGEQPPAVTRPATAFRDRGRGIVSFRSGWDADATFVVFDGSQRSPAAQGHFHDSCGHFSISAVGEYFAIDTGRYNGEQNCHNVVLIDGKSGRTTDGEWTQSVHHGRLTGYWPDAFCDTAAVDSSHQHNAYWAWRHLGLVKGRGARPYIWVVDDLNKANAWAEYWWQLQTSPENTVAIYGAQATITGWRHGNSMDVHFALPAPEEYARPHHLIGLSVDEATPSAFKYIPNPRGNVSDFVRPAAMLHGPVFVRPRLLAKIEGYNGRFMSLMLPRCKDEAPAAVERLPSLSASLAVRITFAEVEDIVIFAHEHNLLEAADIRGRGQWCVVRRDRKTGMVLEHALGQGVFLMAADRILVALDEKETE